MNKVAATALVFIGMAVVLMVLYLSVLALALSLVFPVTWLQAFVGLFVAYSVVSVGTNQRTSLPSRQ